MSIRERAALLQLSTDWMTHARHLRQWERKHGRGLHQSAADTYESTATGLRRVLKELKNAKTKTKK